MNDYDAIVIGAGGVGSAALFHLASRGARVLGIDRFPPGHDRGSSHGQTRVIRQAYFEHPDYVPLLKRAYQLWLELGDAAEEKLLHEIGLLQVGPPQGTVLRGVRESALRHRLAIEELSAADVSKRFPGFALDPDQAAIFEQRAGYLAVERCVVAHVTQAIAHGAQLMTDATVERWTADGRGTRVHTDRGIFTAGRLVVAAGAWAAQVLAELRLPLVVLRKTQFWYPASSPAYWADRGCPAYLFELPPRIIYGVPQVDSLGLKVAEHTGGTPIDDPLAVDHGLHAGDPEDDRKRVEAFLARHLPGVGRPLNAHSACMYTMTPDEHFIVDRHPIHEQVMFAAGLSGHGFKFTSVLGEILAELALEGRATQPIEFLSLARLRPRFM